MKEGKWLCPHCIYGHLFRIAKNEQHIPTHEEYMCVDLPQGEKDILSAPKGPGGWDGKECPNFINNQPVKVCQFYTVGKSNKKLLAYDEYDSLGSGRYFTDDVSMCDRYTLSEAEEASQKYKLDIYLVTIEKRDKDSEIKIDVFSTFEKEKT